MKAVTNPSALFLQAVRADSNIEMDWWWLMQWVSSKTEREFCLEKILHINPTSKAAQKELKVLQNSSRPVSSKFTKRGFVWRTMIRRESGA